MADTNPDAEKGTGKFSPLAGCSMFIITGGIALMIVIVGLWVGNEMQNQIRSFTEENAQDVQSVDLNGKESAQVALKSKFVGFRHDIEAKHKAEITLSAEELNLSVATFEILKPQRGRLFISGVQDDQITADISYPLKDGMMSIFTGKVRYLNGSITIEPELVEGAVFPRIVEIKPAAGGSIPEELRQEISKTILHPIMNDEELGPLFKSLSSVEIKDNTLIVQTDPGYQIPDAPVEETPKTFLDRFMIGFGVISVIFLAIVSFILILSRRKAKES